MRTTFVIGILAWTAFPGPIPAHPLLFADAKNPYTEIDQHARKASPEVEATVSGLAKYLQAEATTERQKVRAIYRWITDRVAYDAESFLSGRRGDNSAQAVLAGRKAVCEGYATLFQELCEKSGIKAVKVRGYALGVRAVRGQVGKETNHAWNAVSFEDRWWLIDSCWGAGHLQGQGFVKKFSEFYFLCDPEQFVFSHFPSEPRWQLLSKPLSATEFQSQPEVRNLLFELGVTGGAVRETVNAPGFQSLVHVYAHPGNARAVRLPLVKHLKAGQEYAFEFHSEDYGEFVLIEGGKKFTPFTWVNGVFQATLRPRKGTLMVAAKRAMGDQKYSGILEYLVE